ncbi:mannosyl-oligosaccharide 1 2-alpha-mannosidase MNS3 [Prunus yedoensis var. nudiflora]|uniref:alpha-1,2-Mannosidase n=1 Tax=Prunus yedoensis var. nudiflora TaxID=2094558 RepID=A0A314ZSJ4_PRUYE|nr:mannosyl-oligosaccharide 1 2-alpha-mannosidase MNS3 [Prunus yedoensis var. nudiflora]
MWSKSLPYSKKDVYYDNAKFRHRSFVKMISQSLHTSNLSTLRAVALDLEIFSENHQGFLLNYRLMKKVAIGNVGDERRKLNSDPKWIARQQDVKKAFIHAWSGYKKYAMGFDELMPVSKHGVDGLGGLGATVVDALDTAMIMGADEVVSEASLWIETHFQIGLINGTS